MIAVVSWAMARLPGAGVGVHAQVTSRGTDEELVGRAAGGDREAFDDLYRRHVDLVWSRLGHLIGPDPEREDLLQQIFLEVFRDLGRFRGQAAFRTFLYRVVVNTAYDHLKRRGRRPHAVSVDQLDTLVDRAANPESRAVERQQIAFSLALLDRLKPKKRIAFLLRVVEGLSLEEIAGLVDATPAAVAQRVRHAHLELEEIARKTVRRTGGEQ